MDLFLRTGEYRFFEKYFDFYCVDNGHVEDPVIKFDQFKQIVNECEKFSPKNIPIIVDKIERQCREKLRKKEDEILINRKDFFVYIEIAVKENDKNENENDDELREIFDSLCGQSTTLNKKYFCDVLLSLGLPISLDDFMGPLKKKEEITHLEFCSLFKKKNDNSGIKFSTFYSSFYNTKDYMMGKPGKDNFPIRYENIDSEM